MTPLVLEGGQVAGLFLVLVRCTGVVVTAPLFGHRALPATVKAALAVALAVALAPAAAMAPGATPVLLAAPLELMIGLAMGFLLSLGFHAMEIAGRLISLQLGLSLDAVFNPATDANQATVLDPLFAVLTGITYLALDLHVEAVRVLGGSFTAFPIGGAWPLDLWLLVGRLVVLAIDLGTRIAFPIALVLLLVELFVGLVARAIPQINVFILGLPAKLLVGMSVLAIAMPTLTSGAARVFRAVFSAVAAAGS
jgi:flagellar biosynthetic protein FliR